MKAKLQRGQDMTEYLVIVAHMAVAAVSPASFSARPSAPDGRYRPRGGRPGCERSHQRTVQPMRELKAPPAQA
jgi:hypothetical protein